ncbi:thiamine-phosphate kinase [Rhodovibrio salinarum]|uniref:Thiamine-monophosphate kinase n=1 Tax=Rhodovibrio salinarum TaxID=1087 RepID=A0A934V195_9PROT|nr:thiamine-phosphate kinase [Rhodovibrio salinarum]MBK1697934.1 thiamine-phosphate kinase [Rhodovibrio salinarum]
MRGEFELIARHFAPLAADVSGAFGLQDDAAVIQPESGRDLVYTSDTISAGVHYLPDDPAGDVARKLLRVNLSDLAAMGARPEGYLLNAAFQADVEETWIAEFAAGLAADQESYGIHIWGGDTTRTQGATVLSLSAIGSVPHGQCLRRSGARAGNYIFVSGTIGDAAFGLKIALGELADELDGGTQAILVDRYRRPRPRVTLGEGLLARNLATAALDISDGLVADLAHLCAASGLAAEIDAAALPLSTGVQQLIERDSARLSTALTGGDDYELVFAVPSERRDALVELARELDLPLTCIGHLEEGAGEVTVRGPDGTVVKTAQTGWQHF